MMNRDYQLPPLTVVKVGGAVVDDADALSSLLAKFAALRGPRILVHGGGRTATQVASDLNITTRMVEGRRITDEQMLRVVTMVYGGLVNKTIVTQLQQRQVNALGLSGADMNIIVSHRRPPRGGVDYGLVGDIDRVDADALCALLDAGVTPVIAPLTHDGRGQLLNTNADTIASSVACALTRYFRVTLVYVFEKPGVLARADDDKSVIPLINHQLYGQLVAEGTISGGMRPKIQNALDAVDRGVDTVVIQQASALGTGLGTLVKA